MGNVMESGLGGGFYEGGCQSQTYKSNLSDWLTRYNAYGALGMQELKGHYDSILSIMGSANDDIDNSGIDFVDLKKIELAYTSYDVEAMEKMRKNLTDFALTVHSDAKSLIDDVIDLALLNLKIQISDHEELKITYLGTPFDLEYNIEDPKHLSDWLYKSVDGSVDDFLYTGDRKKDNLIKEFIEKDEDTGRYVFEDKMDEWSTLSDDEKEVIRHLTVYYGGQYDAYYDDTNEFAKDYKDKEERILTKCVKIESRAADSSNPDTYDPENPGSRVFVYSEAGKGLMGMVDKNSYTGQLIGGLSKIDVDLYDLARNCNPTGNKDFQYIYGDQNSGVTFKIKLSHDRAATAISLGLSYDKDKDPKKTEANRQYYETYKDSFDAINEHLAQEEPYAYFTDYRRSLGYVDRTIEKNPTTYEHVENMGMDKTRVALIISKAENPYDMECLDELTKTNGSYDKAFSIDANKLSDSAKDQIKEYVGIIKNKAYSDVNPHSDACWEELVKLCAYFDDADSKELAGYWPICEKDLAKTRTDLTYMAFRQSPYYSPEFESRMMMAEQMASGAPYSQAAKDEWFKDSQNQEAYYVIMRAKHPDLVGAKWEDMSKEQRERYGDISKVFDESHRMIMLNNIEDVHKAEALYMIDEKNGLNADVYAICDKIKKEEKLNPFTKVSDPYSLLTEDEKKKVETYVLRNCVNPSMTQQGYEALDKLSEVVTNHIEQDEYYQEAKKKTIGKPILKYVLDWTKSGGLFIPSILDSNNDKYEYYAIKRGSQQDILYLAAKEAHNTAYVMDEAWETGLVHYGDAFVHGVGSIIKTSENLDYFIEKKIGWGDETYQQYIDYENQVINRNFDQAQAFSPLLYGTGEMARDLVLMYYGGQLFEATGLTESLTAKATEKLATKAGTNLATKFVTGAIEVGAEQVVPTVVSVIPKAAEGIAEGKSGEEVLKDALFEEGINIGFSTIFRLGKAGYTWLKNADDAVKAASGATGEAELLAENLFKKAESVEKETTSLMKSFEVDGRHLEGLDYRFKSQESLSRKIVTKSHQKGISLEEAASEIDDSLRYTLVSDEAGYCQMVDETLNRLEREGYTIKNFKNTWGDDVYQGINVSIKSPEGVSLELQFHTDASYYTKEHLNHAYYEIARSETATAEEVAEATEKMKANQALVNRPAGARNLEVIDEKIYNGSYSGDDWCRYLRNEYGIENVTWEDASPSQLARSWQGEGKYPGVDEYADVVVKKGTILYRGEPNGTEYFTTLDAIEESGRDSRKIFRGLQVEESPTHGYRPEMKGYMLDEDLATAYGITKANPQFGEGGLPQYYVPDAKKLIEDGVLKQVDDIKLYKYNEVGALSADDVNKTIAKNIRPDNQPLYRPGTTVKEIELTEKATLVKVYESSSDSAEILLKAEDIKGLTPVEIQKKFALPRTPKYICDVELEKGTHLRVGEVNLLEKDASEGAMQYEQIGQNAGSIKNERLLDMGEELIEDNASKLEKKDAVENKGGSGSVKYVDLDSLGRTTGVEAVITPDMIGTGSPAKSSIKPAGFGGQAQGHARGHLLGNQLGGSGSDPRNLMTIYQNPVNHPVMSSIEANVRKAVEGGQIVNYKVTPIYNGNNLIPRGITIQATGDDGFYIYQTILNGK